MLVTSVVSKAAIFKKPEHTVAFFYNVWYDNHMNEDTLFKVNTDVTHGRGYVYSLQYHIVWATKYRKPVLSGQIYDDIMSYLRTTAKDLDMDIRAMEVMPDHVHMLVSCKPQLRLSDAIKVLVV